MDVVTVDDLELELRGSPRRRSLQVTVDRGGELLVFAPTGCEARVIEQFVRAKRLWIYRELERKKQLLPLAQTKEYASGEGFLYLGRTHRVILVDDQSVPLKLDEGRFKLLRSAAGDGREHMVAWYIAHAQPWLATRVERVSCRVGSAPRRIVVRDLGFRWGSCGKDGTVYFNWRSILLPPHAIDYVIAHELLHLRETRHSRNFWRGMERAMPDFRSRKEWLAENGHMVGM